MIFGKNHESGTSLVEQTVTKNLSRFAIGLTRFKTESLAVLLTGGLGLYSAIYGPDNSPPQFKISYTCEDNKLPYNRQPGRHIEVTVESEFNNEKGGLAIYWTPQRLRRFYVNNPFPGSVTESLEMPSTAGYQQGDTTHVRVLYSVNPDPLEVSKGLEVASAVIPLTC